MSVKPSASARVRGQLVSGDDVQGVAPAIILCDPKYPHNGGGGFRNSAYLGVGQVWITGDRLKDQFLREGRLTREERHRDITSRTELYWSDKPFARFPRGTVFVGVEVRPNSEVFTLRWEHPENAVYVFGPEDGSLPYTARRECSRFVLLPSDGCLNLQVAIGWVLGHRRQYRMDAGREPMRAAYDMMQDDRGFADPGDDW